MAKSRESEKLSQFLDSGVYWFQSSNAVFIDPVRVLNRSYSHSKLSPSAYYCRSFQSKPSGEGEGEGEGEVATPSNLKKRKRKRTEKTPPALNERERAADQRHQEVRPFPLKAHETLLQANDLLSVIANLSSGEAEPEEDGKAILPQRSFVELGQLWQAPLYEIILNFPKPEKSTDNEGSPHVDAGEQIAVPIFCSLVSNATNDEIKAEFLDRQYIIPRESYFYMIYWKYHSHVVSCLCWTMWKSDLQQIHHLIPAEANKGYHLIVVDPPWENGSARQKLRYPTLPNRFFLSLPIKQLAHEEGALVALWVTNREKLRRFVEEELFPAWGIQHMTTFHWLKVKTDGSLICDLDLFHHRPYESLLLGYCERKTVNCGKQSRSMDIRDNLVMISVPGDYSRKPPIEELVRDFVPGVKPHCIELFAREMKAGWLSWGNEPLYFQDIRYFQRR